MFTYQKTYQKANGRKLRIIYKMITAVKEIKMTWKFSRENHQVRVTKSGVKLYKT